MTTKATGTLTPFGDGDDERLGESLRAGEVPVAVYGLGKVGLPLAAVYADATSNVTGVDINEAVVEQVNRGEPPFDHEPGLRSLLEEHVNAGNLVATADGADAAATASLHIVIVPVSVNAPTDKRAPKWTPEGASRSDATTERRADLSALTSAIDDISQGLSAGDLVIIESTVPPGTSAGLVTDRLCQQSGLDRDRFGVAFSPERISSGRAIEDLRGAYPKIVGGTTPRATRAAARCYRSMYGGQVIVVSDATTAEAVKVFEGVYRDVNIALANELGTTTDELGIDVREAIAAANTQPYCNIHDPGAGVGGHCIPTYPYFLLSPMSTDLPLIRTARRVNDAMPEFVVSKTIDELERRDVDPHAATVAVLGITYRGEIPETTASPAFPILEGLLERGVTVVAVDPIVDAVDGLEVPLVDLDAFYALNPDAAVLVTAHEAFSRIEWTRLEDLIVIDSRDALDVENHQQYTIGRGYR